MMPGSYIQNSSPHAHLCGVDNSIGHFFLGSLKFLCIFHSCFLTYNITTKKDLEKIYQKPLHCWDYVEILKWSLCAPDDFINKSSKRTRNLCYKKVLAFDIHEEGKRVYVQVQHKCFFHLEPWHAKWIMCPASHYLGSKPIKENCPLPRFACLNNKVSRFKRLCGMSNAKSRLAISAAL